MSLIPLLKLRFASPGVVVDIGRLPGLTGVTSDGSTIRIGALTRHVDVERGAEFRRLCPILHKTAPRSPIRWSATWARLAGRSATPTRPVTGGR